MEGSTSIERNRSPFLRPASQARSPHRLGHSPPHPPLPPVTPLHPFPLSHFSSPSLSLPLPSTHPSPLCLPVLPSSLPLPPTLCKLIHPVFSAAVHPTTTAVTCIARQFTMHGFINPAASPTPASPAFVPAVEADVLGLAPTRSNQHSPVTEQRKY
ncbi:hypothetical protein B0H14DRAFT_3472561 [Mycena olivaceomarginata]|nr:hypothetical protein B0H14DRAFT_3472561 [Mycena olivaceomarginata]